MNEIRRLYRKHSKLQKRVFREINEATRTKNPPILDDFVAERTALLRSTHNEILEWHTWHLLSEAACLDIDPPSDESSWNRDRGGAGLRNTLTPSGRAIVRRLIDEEKTRRRDVKAWWWKNVIIPAITALTGLAGVITGMIAVIHAKK